MLLWINSIKFVSQQILHIPTWQTPEENPTLKRFNTFNVSFPPPESFLTLTYVEGSPFGLFGALFSLRFILETGMFELQHREERRPLTQITHWGVGVLQLRHWVNAWQNLRGKKTIKTQQWWIKTMASSINWQTCFKLEKDKIRHN